MNANIRKRLEKLEGRMKPPEEKRTPLTREQLTRFAQEYLEKGEPHVVEPQRNIGHHFYTPDQKRAIAEEYLRSIAAEGRTVVNGF